MKLKWFTDEFELWKGDDLINNFLAFIRFFDIGDGNNDVSVSVYKI